MFLSNDVECSAREIRKLALFNDLRIYELASAIIEEYLKDQERVRVLIRKLTI